MYVLVRVIVRLTSLVRTITITQRTFVHSCAVYKCCVQMRISNTFLSSPHNGKFATPVHLMPARSTDQQPPSRRTGRVLSRAMKRRRHGTGERSQRFTCPFPGCNIGFVEKAKYLKHLRQKYCDLNENIHIIHKLESEDEKASVFDALCPMFNSMALKEASDFQCSQTPLSGGQRPLEVGPMPRHSRNLDSTSVPKVGLLSMVFVCADNQVLLQ